MYHYYYVSKIFFYLPKINICAIKNNHHMYGNSDPLDATVSPGNRKHISKAHIEI
jgi:hypothetical protein